MSVPPSLYDYVDRFKDLLPPGTWRQLSTDLTKNDVLALIHLNRAQESRMSDLAAYLEAPLNTTTGVVSRLRRRGLVERHNSPDDKRTVLISLTDDGRRLVARGIRDTTALVGRLFEELAEDEVAVVLMVLDRIPALLAEHAAPTRQPPRRIPID
ncbi:MAG: MarR family winged helix-turn-helix transcriptional regulator [Propionibacteriaceae bacterium]|nr:MarR family winged helix-turn-helix transcriptional regulator [Propionibacteriaceae bacterium]